MNEQKGGGTNVPVEHNKEECMGANLKLIANLKQPYIKI